MIDKIKYLNLGCGGRYDESWTNIDFVSNTNDVIQCDLKQGIPYEDGYFEVVYHSHVLEHFDKNTGAFFLDECFRVLKKGGVLRVVVPDLEQISREYLTQLNKAREGDVYAKSNYEWILLELIDQLVRTKSGGEMLKYWQKPEILNESYIESRLGEEFTRARKKILKRKANHLNIALPKKASFTLKYFRHLFLNKKEKEYLKIGEFKSSGESHFWMYDEFSLSTSLKKLGFSKVQKVDAFGSNIKDWGLFQSLDIENDQVRKPDSLFIEAIK